MDLSLYFQPIDKEKVLGAEPAKGTYGSETEVNDGVLFPDYLLADLAIIGVKEERRAINNKGCGEGPDSVRRYFYKLQKPATNGGPKVVDLGNILPGATEEDTAFALRTVVTELIKRSVIPVIIGGSQDLTYVNYAAYEHLEQTVNIVSVDPTFDLGDVDDELNSRSWLSKIILHKPNFLFNYGNIGYQTYFVNARMTDLMSKMFFDVHRLGVLRDDLKEIEPLVRDADILSFDISAIRQSDAPGNANATPNGFYGEEACQICRYAGMSDKLSSIGFYEFNPLMDHNGQTAHLIAQMVWYFVEGYGHRKQDFPIGDKKDYLKYRVHLPEVEHELIFYKSDKTDRWWMEVPYPQNQRVRYERHHMVPCSYNDYQTACKEEMPDKWWRAFSKLS